MSTVQVLCPNGRRQNVKITPNTKILQILEDVCQKQKFLPTENYKLIHGRKTLDVTLSVRYANLSNNAKLELVRAENSREESEVTVALQLESGERLQHAFRPTISLWELLLHWENQPDRDLQGQLTKVNAAENGSIQPSCIYMREEVIGELALKETKLRTLGLTGGKVVIRLTHRPVDDSTLAQINERILKEKQRREKLEQAAKASASSSASQAPPTQGPPTQATPTQPPPTQALPTQASAIEPLPTQSTSLSSGQEVSNTLSAQSHAATFPCTVPAETDGSGQLEQPSNSGQSSKEKQSPDPVEPMDVEETECKGGAMEVDKAEGSGQVQSGANSTQGQSGTSTHNEDIERLRALNIPGVEIFTPGDFHDLTPDQQQVATELMRAYFPGIAGNSGNQPLSLSAMQNKNKKPKKTKPSASPFSDFKFPEETKGKDLYKNEMSKVKKEDFRPCDRQTVVYSLEESLGVDAEKTELPDDFFELTEHDIKRLAADQRRRLAELEDQPLMTSAMRHQQLLSQYDRYNKVVVRVQFPDKLVLQGMFRPQETVFAVQKFVKEHLGDKNSPFYLYTSPPKHVLNDISQTMIEAKLVPASVVYFGSEVVKDHYLSSAVMLETSPRIKADEVVHSCFSEVSSEDPVDVRGPQTHTGSAAAAGSSSSAASGTSSSASREGTGTGAKGTSKTVPKWFKIGKT